MLLEERPAVVSFHFGLPAQESINALRDRGIVLLASATNLAEAQAAAADWAQKVYGAQSEKLQAYTDLALPARLASDRKLQELRAWIDPYEYRARLKMPKLLQLGTNDRYWVVNSARWYWDDLLAPKAMSQAPNHGHHLGSRIADANRGVG